jgi:hypothetical protein
MSRTLIPSPIAAARLRRPAVGLFAAWAVACGGGGATGPQPARYTAAGTWRGTAGAVSVNLSLGEFRLSTGGPRLVEGSATFSRAPGEVWRADAGGFRDGDNTGATAERDGAAGLGLSFAAPGTAATLLGSFTGRFDGPDRLVGRVRGAAAPTEPFGSADVPLTLERFRPGS